MTPRTITDPGRFLAELETVRQRRYAIDDIENEPGGRCVAVALPHPAGAALSLSAPAARLTLEMTVEVAAILARAADDIAWAMRHGG
jgi:IclR family acetate operon transcriptional repressor